MLLQALLEELLEALTSLCHSGFLTLCAKLAELQLEFPDMATQVLHDISAWEGWLQVGEGPRALQLLLNLWASVLDLDFDRMHEVLLSLCSSLVQGLLPWPSDPTALCLLAQARSSLAQAAPGLLVGRLRELDDQGLLFQLPPCDEDALADLYTHPSLLPSHLLAAHSQAHLSNLADVLRAMNQPHILHPLHCLQDFLDSLQNPQCWAIVQSQVLS